MRRVENSIDIRKSFPTLLNVLKKNRVFNVFCIFEGFYFNGLLKQKLYVVYYRTVKLQSICFFLVAVFKDDAEPDLSYLNLNHRLTLMNTYNFRTLSRKLTQ